MMHDIRTEEDIDGLWPAAEQDAPVDGATNKAKTDVAEVADEILKSAHFAKDAGGRLYVYKDGVYRNSGEAFVKERVKEIYQSWGLSADWTSHKANEVFEYIKVDCPDMWPKPPADTINVLNGLVDVNTRTLRPHTHEFYSPVQLPVQFDATAKCPAWDKFIAQVFAADSQVVAYQILAWMMTPENSIQKAVLFLGEGSNGKSTYLRGVIAFLGKENTVALSLHKLEQDKFAAARLMGKLANVCPDLPTAHLSSTSMFKALTGGDVVQGEFKFKDSFEFEPFVKLIFSANKPPQSDDDTHGFFRRWLVIPFTRSFEEKAEGTRSRGELDAELAQPEELSGVLNKALLALQTIRKQGFTETDSMRQAWDEFRAATDSLSVWLDQATYEASNVQVLQADLLSAFNRHLTNIGKPIVTKTAFGLALKRARKKVEPCQRTHMGKPRQYVYAGITFKPNEDANA